MHPGRQACSITSCPSQHLIIHQDPQHHQSFKLTISLSSPTNKPTEKRLRSNHHLSAPTISPVVVGEKQNREMRLWQKVAGALKDKNSIWVTTLSTKTIPFTDPTLHTAIIKATSHDQDKVDYKNAQKVFAWIRSSTSLKPLQWSLAARMDKTRCWVVALKGLMIMHGVFYCKIVEVDRVFRLPFDLSNFVDRRSSNGMHALFVRSYFAFLDLRVTLLREDLFDMVDSTMEIEVVNLKNLQDLLDLLLQVKPRTGMKIVGLVLEAMDCIIVEIFDIYSKICKGISRVIGKLQSAGEFEAKMILKILKRATKQGEELGMYFDFCNEIGALNPFDSPVIKRIPEEEISELERFINDGFEVKGLIPKEIEDETGVMTEKWEVFDEEWKGKEGEEDEYFDPFAEFMSVVTVSESQGGCVGGDLITLK